MRTITFAVFACAILCWQPQCYAVVFASFDPATQSRYLADGSLNPSFFVDESQITGVAGDPSDPINRAVLITPMHYLTAAHASEPNPMFRGSDGVLRSYAGASFVDLTTDLGGGMTGSSDLRLYTLSAAIPASHGVTPLAVLDGNPNDLIGQQIIVFGAGNQAGRNVVDAVGTVSRSDGTLPSAVVQYGFDTATNGGTNGLIDEVGLVGGDSGHSAIIQIGNQFAVVGTHFGIDISAGQVPANGDLYDSFSTLVTPYLNEIDTLTNADGFSVSRLSVTAVPEPSSFAAIAVAVTVLLVFRYRRKRGSASNAPSPSI